MTSDPQSLDSWPGGGCPCCADPLDTVKRDLAIVGRLLSVPLPTEVAACLSAELGAVKAEGRAMFAALRTTAAPEACEVFARSVENFRRGVDRLRSTLPAEALAGDGGARPIALCFALQKLANDAQAYALAGGDQRLFLCDSPSACTNSPTER